MRKTIHQILEHQKKSDNALIMNSEQRLERARLLNAAEFGALCMENWPEIRACLAQHNSTGNYSAETAKLLYQLELLYEVVK